MRRFLSVLLVAGVAAGQLVGCTPKPASANPVVEQFLDDWQAQNFEAAGQASDNASQAASTLSASWDGLQAEGVETELTDVKLDGTVATARYNVTWDLPRDRELTYEANMTLNRINDQWRIRWAPSLIHPQLGANQHLELRAVNAERASVISSDGAEVLRPGTVFRVLVDTDAVSNARSTAMTVANAINAARADDESAGTIDADELENNLKGANGTYSVAVVSQAQGQALKTTLERSPEVFFNEEPAMVATDPNFAPDIVSRVAELVESDLEGANGWEIDAVNHDGAVIGQLDYHAPTVAPSVRISLDHNVQRAAEEAVSMRADMKTMLVAIRPSTGEILAVAQSDKADEDGDIALNGQYPPGSTFKIITASAGIQDQGLNSDSIVPCPGSMNIYGRIVNNYNQFSLGDTALTNAFAKSCNTTFANISEQLGQGQLKAMGLSFGLGVDYDIPGLTTITGSIPEGETELERTEAGYGQGADLASPFGMALVSATAAAGHTPLPTLISGHETTASIDVAAPEPETLNQLRTLMRSVVTSGTAAGMQAGGEIYGKTGEAEINEGSHAWFTGYRDDIAFATLVVLGGGSETSVAITDKFLTRLDELNAGGAGTVVGMGPEGAESEAAVVQSDPMVAGQ